MNSADLITSFFNNELSPEQERQFLLTVASSDSMRLGLKSHVMLDRILQEENQEMAVAPTTRRTILREAATVAGLAAGGSQQAAAAEGSEPSTPISSGSGFPAWGATALSLLVALGTFFVGFRLGESLSDEAMAEHSPAQPTELTPPLVEQGPTLRSVLEWIDFDEFSAVPVRIIAGELSAAAEMPNEVFTDEPGPTTAAVRTPAASPSQRNDQADAQTEGDREDPAAASTASGPGSAGGPNTIDPGRTKYSKRKTDN